jgi:hypothetical protein
MKNYIYYLFSAAVLAASGWYNGVYCEPIKNKIYYNADNDFRSTNYCLGKLKKNLENRITQESSICGDSLQNIAKLATLIDSALQKHSEVMMHLEQIQYNNHEYDKNGNIIFRSLSAQEARRFAEAHDSLLYRLDSLCNTQFGRKAGLPSDFKTVLDSIYELHFAQASHDLSFFSS